MASFEWPGLGALMRRLAGLADPDPSPLMIEWERIISEDNRRGVLAGQDKDGRPMPAVTYRPVVEKPKRPTKKQQNGQRGVFAGLGPHAAGLHNNLSSSEYKRLGGPPLAPRGASSRVVTNLFTGHGWDEATDEWFAVGEWAEVVSRKGVPFLTAHFTGANVGRGLAVKLPVRDLRGVRPWGRAQAVRAMQRWGANLLRGT